ncbi:type II secretion system F family protein [Microbacterium sp. P5_E9]
MDERVIGLREAGTRQEPKGTPTIGNTRAPNTAAETVLRLAVLLQAGIVPLRAWGHLADDGDPVATRVAGEVRRGIPLADAIAGCGPEWIDLAAAWTVAADVGAPLAVSLRALAGALRDAAEADDDIRVALAEPAGTAKLMAWLPLVAVGLGVALGFDTLLTLATNPLGIGCLVTGVALIFTAHRWTSALVRRAGAAPGIPGIGAELFAIALTGGVSIDRARAAVLAATGAPADAATEAVLALSRRAGVPAAELLRASAALARHRARVDGRVRAAKLSSRLLIPLGVCTLPAFLLLGVAPMLLSVMSTMSLSL